MTWHKEPRRHSLARMGIKTANNNPTENAMRKEVIASSRKERIDYLIKRMNESRFNDNGIINEKRASELMDERMNSKSLNDKVWDNLSNDKTSGKLFSAQRTDPTLPIVFVKTDYLSSRKGNPITQNGDDNAFGKSVDKLNALINSGEPLESVPIYSLRDGLVVEGNHRVEALKQSGYESVPVRIEGGWD